MVLVRSLLLFLTLVIPFHSHALVRAGIGEASITPPLGAPSAGYADRRGEAMTGEHDPLMATALYIQSERKIVLASVDSLGFTHKMALEIIRQVREMAGFEDALVLIASSHTHSGGGSFLNMPPIDEALAGKYSPKIESYYIEQTVSAIKKATENTVPVRVGIGYGEAHLSKYRGAWPQGVEPLSALALIKIETLKGEPFAVLFNYPMHPTILGADNRLFSADFVHFARASIKESLGPKVAALYFNGAQGDIIPKETQRTFEACERVGRALGDAVLKAWQATKTNDDLLMQSASIQYAFEPQATPFGLQLPIKEYSSEMHVLLVNKSHAFITIPGELSCVYDRELKCKGKDLGIERVSIWGLVNDAHGYIITKEAWRRKTYESALSFGGEDYGEDIFSKAVDLLEQVKE